MALEKTNYAPETDDANEVIYRKLRKHFDGKIVRKDLTKAIKEGANVPVYVLEFLLGQYCSSDDPKIIEDGVRNVKRILSENFVRPDEAQKVLSGLRERGSYTVIDRITVGLNIKFDRYEADFSNLGVRDIPISSGYVSKYDRLLCGGIWCIVGLEYEYVEEDKKSTPIRIVKLTPIQMPHIDMDEIKDGRRAFSKDEWITVLLRSTGMEADRFSVREKWLQLARMLPLIENNFNFCELGPRSTGKSHLYKEISPNSILVSGGQTTVANLFYNMSSKTVGLVGLWDCVAFDEVAGITFKDKDGIQIMKDYMASGSFARGKEEKAASASMVFVGNINQSVDVMLKTSHLFDPFPEAMAYDTAFLDRMHCYIPGWEIPKYRPESFTNDYGFITDYLAEFMREMRKEPFGDVCDKYFRFGKNLNQRDVIAVRKIVSGFAKLLYPNGEFSKEDIEEILIFALEMRRRVKEQLKKIGGMEFYDVNFSYVDNESFEERYVSVPEQGGGKIIPEGLTNPGNVYTISQGKSGMIGVYRLETQMLPGNGKFERTGLGSDRDAKEATNTAFNFLKASGSHISGSISTTTKDYIINYQDLNGIGMTKFLTLPTVIALASCALSKPTLSSLAVLGEISISGTILKVEELASVLGNKFQEDLTRSQAIEDAIANVPNDSKQYARDTLNRLCRKIFEEKMIHFTEITDMKQDDALEMFVRFNSGGKALRKSEITMSILEAYWPSAKTEFGRVLQGSFAGFGSDFIIRAALMLFGDVVKSNISRKIAEDLKNNWSEFKKALKNLETVLRGMKIEVSRFSGSWNVLLPIIYSVYYNPDYNKSLDGIRAYLLRAILFTYFQSGTTGKLQQMKSNTNSYDYEISIEMLDQMNELRVTDGKIDDIVNSEKGSRVAGEALYYLSLNWLNRTYKYEQDHLHPYDRFDGSKPPAVTAEDWKKWRSNRNRLPNLHLLEGRSNGSKNAMRLVDYYNDMNDVQKAAFRNQALIPADVSLEIEQFEEFYEKRKTILTDEIRKLLI